jgi:outer membrane protein assembly factor BamB
MTGLRSTCRRLLALALLGLLAVPLRGDDLLRQTTFPEESTTTADRLKAAAKFADGHDPVGVREAVEEYHRILEEAGNKLVPLDRQHLVRARWLCHLGLSRLPAEGLRLYRSRVDGQARKWFEQGSAGNDETLLRRVVEEAFCSSVGDQALEWLGDLAFERGRFEEAAAWWRHIALPAGSEERKAKEDPSASLLAPRSSLLVFPDPRVDVARVRAKQLLARSLAGGSSVEELAAELEAFRELHGKAEGHFAGRRGNYAAILQELLSRPEPPEPRPWLTFAGDPSRNLVLPPDPRGDANRLLHLKQDGAERSFHLGTHARIEAAPGGRERGFNRVLDPAQAARSLAFHPLIIGHKVLVADARYVTAYDAVTGQAEVWYDLLDAQAGPALKLDLPAVPDLRYTLTAGEDCVLARLGVQYVEAPDTQRADDNPRPPEPPVNFLVCLNLWPDAKGSHFRWQVKPSEVDRTPAVFEGAPVVAGGRAYIAATHVAGGQTITEVHCYPLEARVAAPLRWKQRVCATQELRPRQRRYRQHLLTLAGPNLVYCSHSGAVVALDAATGRLAWALRYPSRGTMQPPDKETVETTAAPAGPEPDQLSARDLAPCLYAGGRLYVAPADYDRLLCLDPATGRLLWEQKIEVVHLLGVGNGRLIFTTRPYNKALQTIDRARATPGADGQLWAVNAATGSLTDDHWEVPNDGGGLVPFGRGLLAGDVVLWPTYNPKKTDHPEQWEVIRQRDGEHPFDLALNGMDRIPCGNLALGDGCLAVAGVEELTIFTSAALLRSQREKKAEEEPQSALSVYQRALARADAGLETEALADLERVPRLDGAGDVWQDQRLADLARQRRWELLHDRASLAGAAGRRDEAADWLQRATAAEFPAGLRLRALRDLAAWWAEARQPEKSVAAWQTVLAEDALRRGLVTDGRGTPRNGADAAEASIDELIRAHGPGVYEALDRQAAELLAGAEKGAGRREVLSRLATAFPNATATAAALLELARADGQEGRRGLAAHEYRLYLRRVGDSPREARVAARDELARLTAVKTPVPGPPLPPDRGWSIALEPGEQLLPVARGAASARRWGAAASLFFGRGRDLVCRAAGTGKTCWSRRLPFVPAWAGRHADLVLAGGPGGVQALTGDDGSVLWEYCLPVTGHGLGHFQLAGERLFFLEDERRLFALDAETGRVLWAEWAPAGALDLPAPGGRFTGHYHAAADWITVQTSGGNVWVLDGKTGRRLHERGGGRPWPRAPLPLDGRRLCIVSDPGAVAVLEPASGKQIARVATGRLSTLSGASPLVAGDAATLLVLSPRNYGSVLCCFDPGTGKARWAEERLVGREPVAPGSLTLDRNAAYLVCGPVLSAHALADGRTLWRVPLPDGAGDWQVRFVRDYLAVYPGAVGPGGWEVRGPFGALRLATPGSGERSGYYSVLLLDSKTGGLVRRLNFRQEAARLPGTTVELRPRRQRPQVQMLEDGVAVSLDGQAWGRLPSAAE